MSSGTATAAVIAPPPTAPPPTAPPPTAPPTAAEAAWQWVSDAIDRLTPDQKRQTLYALGAAAGLLLFWPRRRPAAAAADE